MALWLEIPHSTIDIEGVSLEDDEHLNSRVKALEDENDKLQTNRKYKKEIMDVITFLK